MSTTCTFSAFLQCERGAASVDWVVLAAACVGLGMGVTNVVATEMTELSQEVRAELQRDMLSNPFDINETALGSNGCAHYFLDPYADPAAAAGAASYTANGCAVGTDGSIADAYDGDGNGNGNGNGNGGGQGNNGFGNGAQPAPGNSGPNNNAANASNADDSYSVLISDDDDDDDDD